MAFWSGFAGSVADSITAREADERKQADAAKERDSKIALHLLESPDADVQMAGLSMLQRAAAPAKRKKGLQGLLGGIEQPEDALRPFLDLANAAGRPGQLQAPPAGDGGQIPTAPGPGAASLPAGSPTEPGGPQITRPQPSAVQPPGSPMALARGQAVPAFGEDPSAAGGMGAPGPVGPMAQALQPAGAGQPSAAPPQANVAVTAARLSQDRGALGPGQAAALFWPTAARLSAAKITSDLGAQAEFLQRLGTSPADVRETLMARMGNPQGAMSATRAGTVKLPSGEVVETYIQRDPASNTVGRMYWNGSAMAPLPPGAVEQRLPTGAGGAGLTTHMTAEQAVEQGIIEPGDFPPGTYLKVKETPDGRQQVLPDVRPVPPFGYQAAPTSPFVQGRGGEVQPNPNRAQPHPKVTAAKALAAALSADVQVKAGVPAQTVFARYAQGYPALRGLTLAQVQQLAQLDDAALDADVQRILGPVAIQPPPGGAGPQAQGGPAPGWADAVAAALLKGRQGGGSTVRGSGMPRPRP